MREPNCTELERKTRYRTRTWLVIFLCGLAARVVFAQDDARQPAGYSIPLIDLADQTHRQVVVDREPGQYLGHPTTVLLEDGRTIITVYPKGHGRGAIVMKRSTDGGLTWSKRLPTPESWATSKEVPTIYQVVDPRTGRKRLIMFSGLFPIRMARSQDDGKTWSELQPIGDYGGIVANACLIRLTDGNYVSMFHDDGRFIKGEGRRSGTFTLYQIFSKDGGLTWGPPEAIWSGSDVHLCEPGIIRSPDGKQLAILLRENSRTRNAHVMFSDDEARTWSKPRELPAALTGDRHTAVYAPDGRLFISFRDTTRDSPTQGDWVAWVGTYDDIAKGREGQYRVRLMDNKHRWDCAYPGVLILPDQTIVTTTYGHWAEHDKPYIVSVRLNLEELDALHGATDEAAPGDALRTSGQPNLARVGETGDWLVDRVRRPAQVFHSEGGNELILSNGLISRTWRLSPNAACIGFDNLMTGEAMLRGVKPEAIVEIDGERFEVGGLKGQPNYAYLDPSWLPGLKADPAAFRFTRFEIGLPKERFPWKRVRHHSPDVRWPPTGAYLRMDYEPAPASTERLQGIRVSVHYELYDGIPCLSKWITVHNDGDRAITVNRFTSEILAAVEFASHVGGAPQRYPTPNLHVETDYSFGGGMLARDSNRRAFRWTTDPDFTTQVHYQRKTPCLLEVGPDLGPARVLEPGEVFESFRAFELVFDTTERERKGLAIRRMYRTIAPWVTENPLMMHVRYADWDTVRAAIDQCAEVGFEMVILTFGSGFNIENDSPKYLAEMKKYAEYARGKGVEIGGYSLLASRHVGGGNDVVMPEGQRPTFGNSPCLRSEWGGDYFRKLRQFYEKTGFALLEHDGSYPGDACTATHHPGHRGFDDSRWKQWRLISDFYKWCRTNGVYLNVPDWYYLTGSNKCGMGYRETNWSLPRDQQVIHTRQNIFDGTWEKTPSMGWMFVPLTQYHGGGDAATIEPLREHLDHYGRMLASNLALGVQACYRGPRLYDSEETKRLLVRWVDWFKEYRDILESDVIHGRRADGRDIDWMLHVNPRLKHKAMLVVFNPLDRPVERTIRVGLYYAGLTETAKASHEGKTAETYRLDRAHEIRLPVSVGPRAMTWYVIE